ncbi:hypothetical protein NADFUDRAFT_52988 [Nadsonia fulvescens var. elongata DSM 6958]|uniref:G-patch domain-containing protein n=1 Tax=Nadsonia fulvescens var. elongata DSM 6958 TaxID=857566 RepID=A0A1E3PF18_9ASCO|nr:hypothetical protein NADFUDRAFT_52988 [Nadsonia fulvescens var. elongata DSM 6958]
MSDSESQKNENDSASKDDKLEKLKLPEYFSLYGTRINRSNSSISAPTPKPSFENSETISRPAVHTIRLSKELSKSTKPNSALRFVPIPLNIQKKPREVSLKEISSNSAPVRVDKLLPSKASKTGGRSLTHVHDSLEDFMNRKTPMDSLHRINPEFHDHCRERGKQYRSPQQSPRNKARQTVSAACPSNVGGFQRVPKSYEDEVEADWNEPYDPRQPNSYKAFIQSDERWEEDNDWRQYLIKIKTSTLKNSQLNNDDDVGNVNEKVIENISNVEGNSQLIVEPQNSLSIREFMELGTLDNNEDLSAETTVKSLEKSSFARRTLEKYGWKQGQGLGVHHEGIKKPIRLKTTLSDFAKSVTRPEEPTNAGTIYFKLSSACSDKDLEVETRKLSRTVKIQWLVDLTDELFRKNYEETLPSLVGPILEQRFGNVERITIWTSNKSLLGSLTLIVKFLANESATRALNELKNLLNYDAIVTAYQKDDFERIDFS